MPSGKTHCKIDQTFLIVIFVILVITGEIFKYDIEMLGLLIGINYLSPDLDTNKSWADQNWGFFEVLWNPYSGKFIHEKISHHLILGPGSRIIWVGILFAPLIYLNYQIILTNYVFFIKLFVGIVVANSFHCVSDKIFNKKRLKLLAI